MANIDKFYDNMKDMLSDYEAYAEYEKIGNVSRGLRANTLKIDIEELIRLFNEGVFCKSNLRYTKGTFCSDSISVLESFGGHPYHFAGLFYSQEPSASSVAEVLRPYIGEKILDMCAAPGGKSSHVAALTKGRGVIVSNEIVLNRAKVLKSNMERMGVRNSLITCNSPKQMASVLPNYFDTVIVDAPCSGEGMFLKEPQAKANWSPAYVNECKIRQLEILNYADKCLQNGGVMVYSTCTFNKTENENVIREFIDNHDYKILNIDNVDNVSRGIGMKEAIRIFPHRHGGLGHFVCLMKKISGQTDAEYQYYSPYTPYVNDRADVILNEISTSVKWGETYQYKDGIFIIKEGMPLAKGLNIISCGVKAFEIEKGGRLEPYHSLAMSIAKEDIIREFPLINQRDAEKYLKGETVDAGNVDKGYRIATVDGYPVGFVKISDGIAKNRLPKGLRMAAVKY